MRSIRSWLTAILLGASSACAVPAMAAPGDGAADPQAAAAPAGAPSSEIKPPLPSWPPWLPSPQVFSPIAPYEGPDLRILPGYAVPLDGAFAVTDDRAVEMRLLASAGIILLLGSNSGYYWRDVENVADWELRWSGPDWRRKLITMEGVSLDTNLFETNTVKHPLAGTLYYLSARGSGLGRAESFAFAVAGSTVWEYVAEFREKVSLNDLIVTPTGGIAVGEPMHDLARFFERGSGGPAQEALAVVLSPMRALSRFLDHRRREQAERLDSLGLPADTWHRFDLFLGGGATDSGDGLRLTETRLGFRTEIIDIPEYERPGQVARAVSDPSFSSIALDSGFDRDGLVEIDFLSKVALGGYYEQDIKGAHGAGLSGYSVFAGTATALGYERHNWPAGYVDKIGIAHLPGLSIDFSFYRHALQLRTVLDVYPGFGAIRSAAIDDYMNGRSLRGIKTVLGERGYYFAYGLTARPALSLRYRTAEVGGDVKMDLFDSIEGADRFQQQVTDDFDLKDRRLSHRVWLTLTMPGEPLKLAWIELEHLQRSGSIGVFRRDRAELRLRGGVGLAF